MPQPSSPNQIPPAPSHRTGGYWSESRRPVVSLVFMAPLLAIYEAGVWLGGIQNGADAWMRQFLDRLGFGQYWALPLLVVAVLLAWHYLCREPWKFSPKILSPMLAECLMLAVVLRMMLFLQHSLFFAGGPAAIPGELQSCINQEARHSCLAEMTGKNACPPDFAVLTAAIHGGFVEKGKLAISYLGAGIYEELLFRLMLLPALIWLVRRFWPAPRPSLMLAVLASSLLFAAAHNLGQAGEPFHGLRFIYLTAAGIFFSILLIYRGFGIAAGTHAAFDILVGLW